MTLSLRTLSLASLALTALFAPCLPAQAQVSFTYQSFDAPGAVTTAPFLGSSASGISASGNIIGTVDTGGSYHGYIRSSSGVFTTFDYPGTGQNGRSTLVLNGGINNAGDATGQYFDNNGIYNFIYHNGQFLTPTLPGVAPVPVGFLNVNEAGLVASQYADANGNEHSAIYNLATNTFTLVPDVPGYTDSYIATVASDGDLLINVDDAANRTHGVLDHNGVDTVLDFPSATIIDTHTDAITDAGLISGNYLDATGHHGFVYDSKAGDWYSLNYPGAVDTYLYLGNSANQFVGYWTDSDSVRHSLLVTAVPEPGNVALLVGFGTTGAGWLTLRRRARKHRAC